MPYEQVTDHNINIIFLKNVSSAEHGVRSNYVVYNLKKN